MLVVVMAQQAEQLLLAITFMLTVALRARLVVVILRDEAAAVEALLVPVQRL